MTVLIVGLGSIGRKHVSVLKSIIPDVKLYALRSDIKAEVLNEIINLHSYREIVDLNVNFAIIANPTSFHKETIGKLLEFNIPLFIEKPLFSSLDIKNLVEDINRRGILTYVACNLRFLDCIVFIKEQLGKSKNKRLNEVNVYCGSYLPDWRPKTDFRKSYSAIPELGGGVHIDLIHELDYLYWLFGHPKAVDKKFKSQSSLCIKAFDYANYLLEYAGFSANIVLNYYRRDPKRCCELVFTDETWFVDLLNNQVICKEEIIFSSEQRISDTYMPQMKYFIDCITTGNKSVNTVDDAYEVLKICLE